MTAFVKFRGRRNAVNEEPKPQQGTNSTRQRIKSRDVVILQIHHSSVDLFVLFCFCAQWGLQSGYYSSWSIDHDSTKIVTWQLAMTLNRMMINGVYIFWSEKHSIPQQRFIIKKVLLSWRQVQNWWSLSDERWNIFKKPSRKVQLPSTLAPKTTVIWMTENLYRHKK